jgi:hypothetical protein
MFVSKSEKIHRVIVGHDLHEFEIPKVWRCESPKPMNINEICLAKEAQRLNLPVTIPEPEYGSNVMSNEDWIKFLSKFERAWENATFTAASDYLSPEVYLNLPEIEPGEYYTKKNEAWQSIKIKKNSTYNSKSSIGNTTDKNKLLEKGFAEEAIISALRSSAAWHASMERWHWGPGRKKQEEKEEKRRAELAAHFGI